MITPSSTEPTTQQPIPIDIFVDEIVTRDFDHSETDYQALVELEHATWPDLPTTICAQRTFAQERPNVRWHQKVCSVNGSVVGFGSLGEAFWLDRPGGFHLYAVAHPSHRRQGIGSRIFQDLVQGIPCQQIQTLNSGCREDQVGGLSFLQENAFLEHKRHAETELDLHRFTPNRSPETSPATRQFTLKALPDLMQTDPDWNKNFRNLDHRIQAASVHPRNFDKVSLQQFTENHLHHSNFDPHLCWIGFDEAKDWIGVSELRTTTDPNSLETFRTGVDSAWRGKGLASSLLSQVIASTKLQGITKILTYGNPLDEIGCLHRSFGVEFQPAWIGMRKQL